MERATEIVFITLLIMFLYITGPLYDSFYSIDIAVDNHVNTITNNFQREIRKDGYIDLKTYDTFLRELASTKRPYEVELIHSVRNVYPKGVGDYQVLYSDYGTKDILKTIYDKGGKYKLKAGDDFFITVKEKSFDNSKIVINTLYGSSTTDLNSKLVFARYGGEVGNEE